MSGKVSGQVWDLDVRALVERARETGHIAADLKVEPQPLRTVLLALADHADHNGRNVYPGVELLAWKTELSERRVRELLSLARCLGVLVPVRYAKGGRGHATEYRLDFSKAAHKAPIQPKPAPEDRVSENPAVEFSVSPERMNSDAESLQPETERMNSDAERMNFGGINPEAGFSPTGLTVTGTVTGEPSPEPSRVRARDGIFDDGDRHLDGQADDLWARVLERLRPAIDPVQFDAYLVPARAVSYSATRQVLVAEPGERLHVPWLVGRFGGVIGKALLDELGHAVHVDWRPTREEIEAELEAMAEAKANRVVEVAPSLLAEHERLLALERSRARSPGVQLDRPLPAGGSIPVENHP